jgi:hypothetical protein
MMNRRRILEYVLLVLAGFCLEWATEFTGLVDRVQYIDTLVGLKEEEDKVSTASINTELKSTTSTYNNTDEKLQFVFVVGLEGTGHHLMSIIVNESPDLTRLKRLKIHPAKSKQLHKALFNSQTKKGLWNAHCSGEDGLNITDIQHHVVEVLQKMRQMAEPSPSRLRFPVNTVGTSGIGMASYPNFHGICRSLNYPSLDLFYDACELAEVDCRHVYLYRDPHQVLHSTTIHRSFNGNLLKAIQLYNTLLHVIATDLETHASRTVGCFGFYENTTENWWDPVGELWGWRNLTKYDQVMAKLYKPPKGTGKNETWFPKEIAPYMKSFIDAHERVIRICRESLPV